MEYDETDADGSNQDLTVEVELPVEGNASVREQREKLYDGEPTGEGGVRTLDQSHRERVMGEITKLIHQIY